MPVSALALDGLWILVRVGDEHLAMSSSRVLEMMRAPVVHSVPRAPSDVRGVATLRGQVGPVVDLRRRLSLESLHDEQAALVKLLHDREHDHREWLADLDASVAERRPFKRTLDPHACAFGKWYDQYKAPTLELDWHLRQFAKPHAAIHELGRKVAALMRQQQYNEATSLIAQARDAEFAWLVTLFDGARGLVKSSAREIVVVVAVNGRSIGLIVDEVEGVDQLAPDTFAALPGGFRSEDRAMAGTVRTRRDDRVVLVFDLAVLAGDYVGIRAVA